MNSEKEIPLLRCSHCSTRLRRNATSTVCRKCRFEGHKEYGECDKCEISSTPEHE